jgi:hypothetical protein
MADQDGTGGGLARRNAAKIFIAFAGTAMWICGVLFRNDSEPVSITLIILGAGLTLASPLLDRLEGEQGFGQDGFKINLGTREAQARNNQLTNVTDIPRKLPSPSKDTPDATDLPKKPMLPVQPGLAPTVQDVRIDFTDDARRDLNQLDSSERATILDTIHKSLRRGGAGSKSVHLSGEDYRVLRASSKRVVFRAADAVPEDNRHRYIVMGIYDRADVPPQFR